MLTDNIKSEIKKVIVGKDEIIEKVLTAILAQGHILLEDVPGVGKTSLALAFSKALGLDCKRIQFTPDTMPSDVTGFSVLKNLSSDMKLELIFRLSKSLLSKDQFIDDNWASKFAGEWKDSRSAESIIEDIRNSRTSNREIEL